MAILLVALFGLVYWTLLGGREQLRSEVIERLKPLLGKDLVIGRIVLSPARIRLNDVSFSPHSSLRIRIETISITPDLWSWLSQGEAGKPLRKIEIFKPTVWLTADTTSSDAAPSLKYPPHPLRRLRVFRSIAEITLSDGLFLPAGEEPPYLRDIELQLKTSPAGKVTLTMGARPPGASGSALQASLEGDLQSGDFDAEIKARIESLSDVVLPGVVTSPVALQSGRLNADLSITGFDEMRLGGVLNAEGIRLRLPNGLEMDEGQVKANLYGATLRFEGSGRLDGTPLVVSGESRNLLANEWLLEGGIEDLPAGVLGRIYPDLPQLSGNLKGVVRAEVRKGQLTARATVRSHKISVDSYDLNDLELDAYIDSGQLQIERLSAWLWGGELKLKGTYEFRDTNGALDGSFHRRWTADDLPGWLAVADPRLRLDFEASLHSGSWLGSGNGWVFEGNGDQILALGISASPDEAQLVISLPFEDDDELADFRWQRADQTPLHLTTSRLERVVKRLLRQSVITEQLESARLNLRGSGHPDSMELTLDAVFEKGEVWRIASCLTSNPDGLHLEGSVSGTGQNEPVGRLHFSFSQISGEAAGAKGDIRIDYLAGFDRRGIRVLEGRGAINTNHFFGSDLAIQFIGIRPFEWLSLAGFEGIPGLYFGADANVEINSGQARYDLKGVLLYDDGAAMELFSSGSIDSLRIDVRQLFLRPKGDESVILQLAGVYYYGSRYLEGAFLQLDKMPLGRLVPLLNRSAEAGRFGGEVNGYIEVNGVLDSPELTFDLHLLKGRLFGTDGYWANLSGGMDELGDYRLSRGDFGIGIERLLTIHASRQREGRWSRLSARGDAVDLGMLFTGIAGLSSQLDGRSSIDLDLAGAALPGNGQLAITLSAGSFFALPFDRGHLSLNLSGLFGSAPQLIIDRLTFDLGDLRATAQGQIPLTAPHPLEVVASLNGNLFELLHRADPHFFSRPEGAGGVTITLGGTIDAPRLTSGRIDLRGGGIRLAQVARRIEGVLIDVRLDPGAPGIGVGDTRLPYIDIRRLNGRSDDKPFFFSNRRADLLHGEQPIVVGGFDCGILQFATGGDGVWLAIPGLSEPGSGGFFRVRGLDGRGALEFAGPLERPSAVGEIALRNLTMTYPPVVYGSGEVSPFVRGLLDLASRTDWRIHVFPDRNCNYVRDVSALGELPGFSTLRRRVGSDWVDIDLKLRLDLRIEDDMTGITVRGTPRDSIAISGELTASQGTIEVLDTRFNVNRAGLRFSPPDPEPRLYGSAWTTVTDTATGGPVEVRLRLQSAGRLDAAGYGPEEPVEWGNLVVIFEDDRGHSLEQIIALLGYTPAQLPTRLGGGQLVQLAPIGRWTRTFERQMEKWLGVDRVTFETNVARSLLDPRFYTPSDTGRTGALPYWTALYGSRLTVGKYMSRQLYLSYTGAVASEATVASATRLGLLHLWDALYRLPGAAERFTLNYRYEYDGLSLDRFQSLLMRYTMVFDLGQRLKF